MSTDPVRADESASPLAGPLSSIEIRARGAERPSDPGMLSDQRVSVPWVLRGLRAVPERVAPEYGYDPVRHVAADRHRRPLVPDPRKDWTTIEGTHTDVTVATTKWGTGKKSRDGCWCRHATSTRPPMPS